MGGGPAAKARTAAENASIPWYADAGVDVFAAWASAIAVSPFIMTVDKAVVTASAGKASLGRALFDNIKDFLRPHRMLMQPSLWMVAGVYGATYSAANLIDSACERLLDHSDENSASVHGAVKLVGTTCVNMSAAITKDTMFARMFGSGPAAGPMPRATIGFFALRDVLTIGAAFTLPKQLASMFSTTGMVDEKYAGETAQLVSPVAMQIICSPVHLAALHHYNVREATFNERVKGVLSTNGGTTIARMIRMAPAYGIGGVMNTSLVHRGRDYNLEEYYSKPARMAAEAVTLPSDKTETYGEHKDVGAAQLHRKLSKASTGRRRIMDTYGEEESKGKVLLRRTSSKSAEVFRKLSSSEHYVPAQQGYYPELSELLEKKLGLVEEDEASWAQDVPTLARMSSLVDEPVSAAARAAAAAEASKKK